MQRDRIWATVIVMVVASAAIARTASAQGQEELSVGSRIRIGLPDSLRVSPFERRGQWVAGTLVRATQDSLVLHVGGANPLSVARRDITGIGISEGSSRMRSAVHHAFDWALLYTSATLIVEGDQGSVHGRRIAKLAGTGAAIGAFLGVLSPFEHWRNVKR
jgi:hypothetical protein